MSVQLRISVVIAEITRGWRHWGDRARSLEITRGKKRDHYQHWTCLPFDQESIGGRTTDCRKQYFGSDGIDLQCLCPKHQSTGIVNIPQKTSPSKRSTGWWRRHFTMPTSPMSMKWFMSCRTIQGGRSGFHRRSIRYERPVGMEGGCQHHPQPRNPSLGAILGRKGRLPLRARGLGIYSKFRIRGSNKLTASGQIRLTMEPEGTKPGKLGGLPAGKFGTLGAGQDTPELKFWISISPI